MEKFKYILHINQMEKYKFMEIFLGESKSMGILIILWILQINQYFGIFW